MSHGVIELTHVVGCNKFVSFECVVYTFYMFTNTTRRLCLQYIYINITTQSHWNTYWYKYIICKNNIMNAEHVILNWNWCMFSNENIEYTHIYIFFFVILFNIINYLGTTTKIQFLFNPIPVGFIDLHNFISCFSQIWFRKLFQ